MDLSDEFRSYLGLSDSYIEKTSQQGLEALHSTSLRFPCLQQTIPGGGGTISITIPRKSINGLMFPAPSFRSVLTLNFVHSNGTPFAVPLKADPDIGYYALFQEIGISFKAAAAAPTRILTYDAMQLRMWIKDMAEIMEPEEFTIFQQRIGCTIGHHSDFFQGAHKLVDVGHYRPFSNVRSQTLTDSSELWSYDIDLDLPVPLPMFGRTCNHTAVDLEILEADLVVDFILKSQAMFRPHLEFYSARLETGRPAPVVCGPVAVQGAASVNDAHNSNEIQLAQSYANSRGEAAPLVLGMHPNQERVLTSTAVLGLETSDLLLQDVRLHSLASVKPMTINTVPSAYEPVIAAVNDPILSALSLTRGADLGFYIHTDRVEPNRWMTGIAPYSYGINTADTTVTAATWNAGLPNAYNLINSSLNYQSGKTSLEAAITSEGYGWARFLYSTRLRLVQANLYNTGCRSFGTGPALTATSTGDYFINPSCGTGLACSALWPTVLLLNPQTTLATGQIEAPWYIPTAGNFNARGILPIVDKPYSLSRAVIMRDNDHWQDESVGFAVALRPASDANYNTGSYSLWFQNLSWSGTAYVPVSNAPTPPTTFVNTLVASVFPDAPYPSLSHEEVFPGWSSHIYTSSSLGQQPNPPPTNGQNLSVPYTNSVETARYNYHADQWRPRPSLCSKTPMTNYAAQVATFNNTIAAFHAMTNVMGSGTNLSANSALTNRWQDTGLLGCMLQITVTGDDPTNTAVAPLRAAFMLNDGPVLNFNELNFYHNTVLWAGVVGGGYQLVDDWITISPPASTYSSSGGTNYQQLCGIGPKGYVGLVGSSASTQLGKFNNPNFQSTPSSSGSWEPLVFGETVNFDGTNNTNCVVSGGWFRAPGLQCSVGLEIFNNFKYQSSSYFDNSTYVYPSGCTLQSYAFTDIYLMCTLRPPSESVRQASKARGSDGDILRLQWVSTDILLYPLLSSPAASQDSGSVNFNRTFEVTARKAHGLEIGVLANLPNMPYPDHINTVPWQSLEVLFSGRSTLLVETGTFPKPLIPFLSYHTVADETTNTLDGVPFYPPYILPKRIFPNPSLSDFRKLLLTGLYPGASSHAFRRSDCMKLRLTSVPFCDGGFTPLANLNVQINGSVHTKLASSVSRPLPVMQQGQGATFTATALVTPTRWPMDFKNRIQGTPHYQPSLFMTQLGPSKGLYRIVPPNTELVLMAAVRLTLDAEYNIKTGSFLLFK